MRDIDRIIALLKAIQSSNNSGFCKYIIAVLITILGSKIIATYFIKMCIKVIPSLQRKMQDPYSWSQQFLKSPFDKPRGRFSNLFNAGIGYLVTIILFIVAMSFSIKGIYGGVLYELSFVGQAILMGIGLVALVIARICKCLADKAWYSYRSSRPGIEALV